MPKRKTIIIGFIVVVVLIAMVLILRQFIFYSQEREEFENKVYNALGDFKTVKEVASYLECEDVKEVNSTNENFEKDIYLSFKFNLYTEGASNQDYFYSAALLFAEVENYENIRLIDNGKQIVIAILGDKKNRKISRLYINGSENYYGEQDTLEALENYTQINISRMDIQSEVLKDLISEDWQTRNVDFGTQESTFDGYDIYFDEGIEVRRIGKKVFNVVFTEKYAYPIVNGIVVNTPFEEVAEKLGTPEFGKVNYNLIGYRGDNIYVFFEKDRVSVYPVEKNLNEQQFLTLVDNFRNTLDVRSFVNGMTDLWPDYDKYDYDSDHVELVYTLKGVKFEYNTQRDNGVIFYSNYNGSYISDLRENKNNLPRYTYFEDKNLIYENERYNTTNRNYSYLRKEYNNLKNMQIENPSLYANRYLSDSSKFFVGTFGEGNLKIISINNDYPPFEIENTTNNYFWIDDNTLVYGIKNRGIYLCNTENRENSILIEGTDNFNIIDYKNGILYYDNTSLLYNLMKQNINTYIWINNYTIAYSKKNEGIYLYNIDTQETSIVLEGIDEFNIIGYENGVLYYDNLNSVYIII